MKNKVVLNHNFAGFQLSEKGLTKFKKLAAQDPASPYHTEEAFESNLHDIEFGDIPRHDKTLVAVVEQFGGKAMEWPNSLEVVEIEGDKYEIIESEDYCEQIITPNTINWTVIK